MTAAEQIRSRVEEMLRKQLSPRQLFEWIASYSWDIHKRADRATQDLAYAVDSLLSDYNDGVLGESELRTSLAEAVGDPSSPLVTRSQLVLRLVDDDRLPTDPNYATWNPHQDFVFGLDAHPEVVRFIDWKEDIQNKAMPVRPSPEFYLGGTSSSLLPFAV